MSAQIREVLSAIQQKGVRLWSAEGQLRYEGPKGALTQEDLACLRLHRDPILSLLTSADPLENRESRPRLRPRQDRAPLSFAQLAHWHLYNLSEHPSRCVIPYAMRLHGVLDIEALRESLRQLARRHTALRTQIVLLEGVPIQQISASGGCELDVRDLTELTEETRELEVRRSLECVVRAPMPVLSSPLTRARLLTLTAREHVFILGMEHIISDGISLRVLVDELLAVYESLTRGDRLSLPDVPIQMAEYAIWQRNMHESWLEQHGSYWTPRVSTWKRLRFPESQPVGQCHGWATVRIEIDNTLKAKLTEWCKRYQTTLVLAALTAYVALVLRWCSASEGVILFQTDGRNDPSIARTVGYFAFPLYLQVELGPSDNFVDLLHKIIDEYCAAYEHADFSYLESQGPRPEFTRNTCFNWLRDSTDSPVAPSNDRALQPVPIHYDESLEKTLLADVQKDAEPSIGLLEAEEAIVGGVYFPADRFSDKDMKRFARNYVAWLSALIEDPESPVREVKLI